MEVEDMVMTCPSELGTRAPFSTLFPVRRELRERIAQSMRERGFDPSKPINVWRQENVVVDGHTRRLAAIEAGVEVVACFHDFKDEDEAMDYAIANQRDRRNLDDAELASLVLVVDRRRKKGGDRKSAECVQSKSIPSSDGIDSSVRTAALTGTSPRKVEKVRAIADYAEATGDSEEKDAVMAGTMTINRAERQVRAKKEAVVSERVAEAMEWWRANGNMPIRRAEGLSGLSNGTLHKARVELGWAKGGKPKTRKEREKAAYRSVRLGGNGDGNGDGDSINPAALQQVESYDCAWLESLPVRAALGQPRGFDADAVIVRECGPLVREIKGRIARLIGDRSVAGMSSVHRALHRVFDLADPVDWAVCGKCEGGGRDGASPCGRCKGGGYIIPNFTRGSS